MFTIYTFGDPELLREALLALATVFGLSEWWDASSGFGAGGNLLAAALIGLLAVAIAGVTSQQIRLDYLLVALILFGVAFGSKTDVQVEDIQSGASFIVADVPIGIAVVASASSSAARNLTETMGVALQRPGTTTSLLTDAGFLDPLRTLLSLRSISFEQLDPHVSRSLLTYYRYCVGHTLQWAPGLFDQRTFMTSGNPIGYMLNSANVLNWSTVYFNDANPGGISQTCHDTGGALAADLGDLTSAASTEALAKIRLSMGARTYDSAFEFADLNTAVEVSTRAIYDGQLFMQNAMMRNFHNVGEAWRLAEYGTNQAKYAVEVTGALEQQRGNAALQGTIFLNMMFPLMTFFQFVFIALAPFIALIVVASPFTAAKTLGGYALFGVWSYSWMPVAAVINHYIQINIGNVFEGADVVGAGVSYLSIIGLDDFYNQLANQIIIGSNALAAAPAIVGAVLFGTFQGLTTLGGQFAKAQAPTKVSSNVSSPTQTVTNPLVNAGGKANYTVGTTPGVGGMVFANNRQRELGGGRLVADSTTTGAIARAQGVYTSASARLSTTTGRARTQMAEIAETGRVGSSRDAQLNTRTAEAAVRALGSNVSNRELSSLNFDQMGKLSARLGVNPKAFMAAAGIQRESLSQTGNKAVFERVSGFIDDNKASVLAEMAETLASTYSNSEEISGAFRKMGQELRSAQSEYASAQEYRDETAARAEQVSRVGIAASGDYAHELFRQQLMMRNAPELMRDVESTLAGELGSEYGGVLEESYDQYIRMGGNRSEFHSDFAGRLTAMNVALNNRAARGEEGGLQTLQSFYRAVGIAGAGEPMDRGAEIRSRVQEGIDRVGGEAGRQVDMSDVSGTARTRIEEGGMRPEGFGDEQRNEMRGVFADSRARNGIQSEDELRAAVDGAATRAQGARQTENRTIPDEMLRFALGRDGFSRSVGALNQALQADLAEGERRQALNLARGQLMGEVGTAGGDAFKVEQVYEGFRDAGLSDEAATVATFGVVGPRKEGAEAFTAQMMIGGILGGDALAERASQRSGRARAISFTRLLRGAGGTVAGAGGAAAALPAVAIGLGVSAASVAIQREANYNAGVEALRDAAKAEFALANRNNPEKVSAFAAAVDRTQTPEELVELIQQPQFALSEDQMDAIEGQMAGPGPGDPDRWGERFRNIR